MLPNRLPSLSLRGDVNLGVGLCGGGLWAKWARPGPASPPSLPRSRWLPWSTGLSVPTLMFLPEASGLSHQHSSAFPSLVPATRAQRQATSPSLWLLSPSSASLPVLLCPDYGLQTSLLYPRTFARATSLPGMLCSHGQIFLVTQV